MLNSLDGVTLLAPASTPTIIIHIKVLNRKKPLTNLPKQCPHQKQSNVTQMSKDGKREERGKVGEAIEGNQLLLPIPSIIDHKVIVQTVDTIVALERVRPATRFQPHTYIRTLLLASSKKDVRLMDLQFSAGVSYMRC